MNTEYKFIKDYKDNKILRDSLNNLAEKSFCGLNFEKWYKSGYWREKYIPYSICHNNKIIANVSVNIMDFIKDGELKKYIQIGTVMTEEIYRGQGLSRFLMENIIEDYKDKVDGIYLWGNDNVIDFYKKFGFIPSKEYQYSKDVINVKERTAISIDMNKEGALKSLENAMKNSIPNSSFESMNYDLYFFYIVNFMMDNVYYIPDIEAYVIAEIDGNKLIINNIFSNNIIDLDKVIEGFGKAVNKVALGFTPINKSEYRISEMVEEDRNFFVMGKGLIEFNKENKMFPSLSHA